MALPLSDDGGDGIVHQAKKPGASGRGVRESQRDSVAKPSNGVARHELPWVSVPQIRPTPTGLRRFRFRPRVWEVRHNPVGVVFISESSPKVAPKVFGATLGWRTQSLWDWSHSNAICFDNAAPPPRRNVWIRIALTSEVVLVAPGTFARAARGEGETGDATISFFERGEAANRFRRRP